MEIGNGLTGKIDPKGKRKFINGSRQAIYPAYGNMAWLSQKIKIYLLPKALICGNIFLFGSFRMKFKICRPVIWLHGQAVKTSPFHGGNTGSIPVGVIFMYGAIAKW